MSALPHAPRFPAPLRHDRGALGGWICEYEQFPAIKWASSSDRTGDFPGLVCTRVENPLPGTSYNTWASFWKLVKLIPDF